MFRRDGSNFRLARRRKPDGGHASMSADTQTHTHIQKYRYATSPPPRVRRSSIARLAFRCRCSTVPSYAVATKFYDSGVDNYRIRLAQNQCLKWSKKEAGSLPQVECIPRIFVTFIFDLKMTSFDAFLVVFYAI